MTKNQRYRRNVKLPLMALAMAVFATSAQAEIDGHGPDGWRVTGVSANDTLNMRMGPGTTYPVIEQLAHNTRDLQQITCVPFYNAGHYSALTQAQIAALPQRWCLMRTAAMDKAGWVSARFVTPEGQVSIQDARRTPPAQRQSYADGDPLIAQAVEMVREIYDWDAVILPGDTMGGPLNPTVAHTYFTDEIVALLASGGLGAHPLYGAQDFDGHVSEPQPDPDSPMYRGMITINVDFVNFGQPQRAIFSLRSDTTKPGAPLRIFNVQHHGWSYP